MDVFTLFVCLSGNVRFSGWVQPTLGLANAGDPTGLVLDWRDRGRPDAETRPG
jgi:hypothetical protein